VIAYCAGTATDVGKTWFGAATLAALRQAGRTVAARKPLQSHDPADGHPTDAEVLAGATGEPADAVCPPERTFGVPMAPPMAADVLGRRCPTTAELLAALARPAVDLLWVEGVGGPRSPLAADGDGVDLQRALAPDRTVLVADAGLGTVNAVRLSVAALGECLVALNRFDADDDLHQRNLDWLRTREGLVVVTSPSALAESLA
jgi:dethiobiotin synthetase